MHWQVEDWARVIFSDEANFEVFNRSSKIYVKRLRSEKFESRFVQPRIQGGQGSVGIWGCVSHKGTGVSSVYTGRIDQHRYKNVLENCLFPSAELMFEPHQHWYFQQDGAPAHRAKSISEFLSQNEISVLPWTPRSPDLNCIEHLRAYIDKRLVKTEINNTQNG